MVPKLLLFSILSVIFVVSLARIESELLGLEVSLLLNEEEAFKNAQESYNLGAMTLFDFDLVRNRLVGAESALIRAKYNYVFKTKVLQFYYGELNLD
jgi:outer membrane protein